MNNDITLFAQTLGDLLKQHGWLLATAESCTGGGLAQAITAIAGSSQWFDCGFVTYSNESKQALLGVNADTLSAYGAVSEQVAIEMAEGALTHSKAHISVAITGVAGPDGGTADKPVGTVWLAWSERGKSSKTIKYQLFGDRSQVRDQAVLVALEGLIGRLTKNN